MYKSHYKDLRDLKGCFFATFAIFFCWKWKQKDLQWSKLRSFLTFLQTLLHFASFCLTCGFLSFEIIVIKCCTLNPIPVWIHLFSVALSSLSQSEYTCSVCFPFFCVRHTESRSHSGNFFLTNSSNIGECKQNLIFLGRIDNS